MMGWTIVELTIGSSVVPPPPPTREEMYPSQKCRAYNMTIPCPSPRKALQTQRAADRKLSAYHSILCTLHVIM